MELSRAFRGRRVLVTGHSGFKGSWLSLWLTELGAEVTGLALAPEAGGLFDQLGLARLVNSRLADVRDAAAVRQVVAECHPEIVFHLAAQPLVRASYANPEETFATNIMGLVNLLEALRACATVKVCQVITTDKCYDNLETGHAYAENDALGGRDPYSASKACAELTTRAYRDSFFTKAGVSVSTARAGNVIGGGDWAQDRVIPDCARALREKKPVLLRSPNSIRPWQHVLEPIRGYLKLAAAQFDRPGEFAEAWNFGPRQEHHLPVYRLVEAFLRAYGSGEYVAVGSDGQPHEAGLLHLDCTKARQRLGWIPQLSIEEAAGLAADWYKGAATPGFDALALTRAQIADYERRWIPAAA